MNLSDTLFYNIFSYYKPKLKQKANRLAVLYISILQIAFVLLLGVFFAKFFKQMNMVTMSSSKAWTLFSLIAVFLYFKNWMQYTGKRRMMINTKRLKKTSKSNHNIYLLWSLPFVLLVLAYILFQAA